MTPEQFELLEYLRFNPLFQEHSAWRGLLEDTRPVQTAELKSLEKEGYITIQPPMGAYGLNSGLLATLTASGEFIAYDGIKAVEMLNELHIWVKTLTNNALLDETLQLAGGDDYDGCMTRGGNCKYELLNNELRLRLKDWLHDSR